PAARRSAKEFARGATPRITKRWQRSGSSSGSGTESASSASKTRILALLSLTCTDGNDNCANPVAGEDAAQKFPAIAEKKRDPVAPYHVAGFKTRADL